MLLPAEIFQVIILVFPLVLLQCILKHAPWTDASVVPTAALDSDIHAITTASTIAFPALLSDSSLFGNGSEAARICNFKIAFLLF